VFSEAASNVNKREIEEDLHWGACSINVIVVYTCEQYIQLRDVQSSYLRDVIALFQLLFVSMLVTQPNRLLLIIDLI
jgi:hypothetical protein